MHPTLLKVNFEEFLNDALLRFMTIRTTYNVIGKVFHCP